MRISKVFKYMAITFTMAALIAGLYVYTDYFKEKQVNNTLVSKDNAIESENLTSKDKESSTLEESDNSKEAASEENKDNLTEAEEVKESEPKKEENKGSATTNIASGEKNKGATGNNGGAPLDVRNTEEPKTAQEAPTKPKEEPQPVKEEPKESAPSPEAPKEQQPPKDSTNTSPTYLPSKYTFSYGEAIENEVIALVNELRKENGLAALSYDSSLRESARYKSNSMLQHEYFSHDNPQLGGKGMSYLLWDVFKINSTRVGENIAYYQGSSEKITAKQIYEQWYNSAPHREAMLSTGFTRIGVGIVVSTKGGTSSYMYGTQHFAK